jgi:class 3 adenylate cyclase
VRVLVWVLHIGIPLLVLWLFIARPRFDVRWEDHTAHFWVVMLAAALNAALGNQMASAANRRGDARLLLVSLAFVCSAGFLALHALVTPKVVVGAANLGFVIATPVGLVLAALFVAASSIEWSDRRAAAIVRRQAVLRWGTALVLVAWAVVNLLEVPPLDRVVTAQEADAPLRWLAFVGVSLYLVAALLYFRVMRRRSSVMLISLITAFLLLAESMVAIALARNWQASWWEWHVLMVIAYAFVAYSAYAQYVREGSATGLFRSISLERTLAAVRDEYDAALEALVDVMDDGAEPGGTSRAAVSAALAGRFDLTEAQIDVLERAAEALATERDQIRRLGALVAVGQEASVIQRDTDLLDNALDIVRDAFARYDLRLGLLENGALRWVEGDGDMPGDAPGPAAEALASLEPVERRTDGDGAQLALPLTVKGHAAGVIVASTPAALAERDRALLRSLTSQLSMALENARLYSQLDGLFRQYMSPDVVTALLADADQAALGGDVVEVSALFADLGGYTPFSERTSPEEVVTVLNRYFAIVVPVILREGGTVSQFIGDAVMALFNAPARQPDHALRAARAGLALQAAVEDVAREHPGWPRFRVGINTGPALIGNIGSAEFRMFTGIGDTINVASRLEGTAEAGQVVIGEATYDAIRAVAVVEPREPMPVKGKAEPLPAYVLRALRDG